MHWMAQLGPGIATHDPERSCGERMGVAPTTAMARSIRMISNQPRPEFFD